MKQTLLLLILITFSFGALAQKNKSEIIVPKMPVDEATGLISYSAKEDVAGATKSVLYSRALGWANSYYKNPAEVIREKDEANGKIVIKGRYRITNEPDKKGVVTQAGNVMYALILEFKDNKYRYDFTQINWQQTSAFPIERWMDTASSSYSKSYPYYLVQTEEAIREVEKSLRKAMVSDGAKKSDDW